jgi:uncharacterized protein YdcH (DUF465 family)/quercetin dioxygenase-like cupin family protein
VLEHHRDLAHEFPEFKARIHDMKLGSGEFRALYREYQELDNEIHRIEQDIETTDDAYAEELKRRRVRLKDHLYGLLSGRIAAAPVTDELFARGKFGRPVRPGTVARDWTARGFSCESFTDAPGQQWCDFVHDSNELVTVVAGQLEVTMAGATWVLAPGDELYIPGGVMHSVRNIDAASTQWLYGYD